MARSWSRSAALLFSSVVVTFGCGSQDHKSPPNPSDTSQGGAVGSQGGHCGADGRDRGSGGNAGRGAAGGAAIADASTVGAAETGQRDAGRGAAAGADNSGNADPSGEGGGAGRGGTSGTDGGTGRGGSADRGGNSGLGGSKEQGGSAGRGGNSAMGGSAGRGGAPAAGGGTSVAGGGSSGGGGSAGPDVWIAPDGKDANPGTETEPLATPAAAIKKICPSACPATGGTIWVKEGTYAVSSTISVSASENGASSTAMMKMWAVAGAAPVFDFSTQPRPSSCNSGSRGMLLSGNYWHVKGITVMKAADSGIIVGGSNNILENCITHDNQDFGVGISGSGSNNLILNCDSYHNFDELCDGENADGFGAKKNSGTGNVFRGCRAWENSDDGFDFYGWTSPITLEDCWAFSNAKNSKYSGSESDGNGFKLGSDSSDGGHKLSGCSSWSNAMRGFTNNGGKNSSCTNCTSCSNANGDQGVSGVTSGGCPTSKGTSSRQADGSLP